MYEDLSLVNGDIIFDNLGKLVLVSDDNVIIQSVRNRLNTRIGDLFYNTKYGLDDLGRLKRLDKYLLEVQSILQSSLFMDGKISQLEIVGYEPIDKDKFSLALKITLMNGKVLNFNYII